MNETFPPPPPSPEMDRLRIVKAKAEIEAIQAAGDLLRSLVSLVKKFTDEREGS